MTIRVAIVGASGKLGSAAAALVDETDDVELVARLGSGDPLDDMLGTAETPSDVVFDATVPQFSGDIVRFAVEHGRNVVVGTSGWSAERIAGLSGLLAQHPERGVVIVPNFSLGSVLGSAFASVAARFFDAVEIVEAHGADKVDSPSGTAVRTAELILQSRAELGPVAATHTDQRARGQQVASVPVHSVRLPGVVAKQQVVFGGAGETLSIVHETVGTAAYSAGILLALRHAATATGVTVGLDSLIDLGVGRAARRTEPTEAVRD